MGKFPQRHPGGEISNDSRGGAPGPGAYSPFMPNQSGRTHGILIETWQLDMNLKTREGNVFSLRSVLVLFFWNLFFFSMVSQEHIF